MFGISRSVSSTSGRADFHGLHGFEAVARQRDFVALVFEQRGDGAAHRHGVVDDQHARAAQLFRLRTRFGRGAHRLSRGVRASSAMSSSGITLPLPVRPMPETPGIRLR